MKCEPILPIIGNVHQIGGRKGEFNVIYINFVKSCLALLMDFLKRICEISKKYNDEPLVMFWRGWNPAVIFHKADHLDMVMSGSKNSEKSFEYDFLRPWLNDGLLTSHGEKWYFRRRLLTPSFHFEILNDFLSVFNEQANILIDVLTKLSKEGKEIDIFERLGYCALDIICETAMGKHASTQIDGSSSEYYRAVAKIVVLVRERAFQPLYWMDWIYGLFQAGREHNECLKKLHNFSRKIIMERSEDFENTNTISKRVAFLDILLKAKSENPSITFDDIQEEVDTFMFEGHDTTAAAMSFACHLIGCHPEVQKKLHEEIDQVLGTIDRDVTNDDLKNFKYLECVIKETLRLFPSVPIFARVVSEDEKVGKYNITKGSSAVVFTYMLHRDEKYFPDPEKFDPDRFLPENTRDRHPYAYVPFSAGKRNCIGQRFAIMEEKVVLANILRKFEIKSLKKTEDLEPIADVILRPLYGIPVKLTLRTH